MKIVSITGVKQAELIDVPTPKAKGRNVVVKILAVPMCTEYKAWSRGDSPKLLGHEAAGEVYETDDIRFEIRKAARKRVEEILVKRKKPPTEE